MRRTKYMMGAIVIMLVALLLAVPPMDAQAQQEAHRLVFASDFHATEGSIQTAMSGMPSDVEYVGLIGDMVGGRGDMTPSYESSWILRQVQEVFPHLDSSNVSIIWASHDLNVDDGDANIVKCPDGYGSTVIYRGMNYDGSTAYYLYAIGFYEMTKGGDVSREASQAFKTWVDGIDKTVPIIVVCHVPLQAKRGDNFGAIYWNEALNYAATGVEGIISTGTDAAITRNVIFLYGHNHTVTPNEYYYAPRSTMLVQIDASEANEVSGSSGLWSQGDDVIEMDVVDEEYEYEDEDDDLILGEAPPSERPWPRKAEGVTSDIYYTALVAGYLKTSGDATLVTITDVVITLERRRGNEIVDLGVDENDQLLSMSQAVIEQFMKENVLVPGSVTVSTVDQDGAEVAGATFVLCHGDEVVATYEGGTFEIRTDEDVLAALLPEAGESITLTLRQSSAPEGYEPNRASHELTIATSAEESLADRVYVTTLTYFVTIDGKESLTVENAKVVPPVEPTDKPTDNPEKADTPIAPQTSRERLPKTGDAQVNSVVLLAMLLFGAALLWQGCRE